VVAPEALQHTIDELRQSPTEAISRLAFGKRSVTEFIASLPAPPQKLLTDSRLRELSRSGVDLDDNIFS
jgi:hypothetical protein